MTRDRLVLGLRTQLTDYLYFGDASDPINSDDDLFELGLDSQGVTRLVVWIGRVAGVSVPQESVTEANFRTIDALVDLVQSRA